MRRRRYFVGLFAALMAASTILIATAAAPAGAVQSSHCKETMDPSGQGNASGLSVSCEFSSAGLSPQIRITDYKDAVWHYGAARTVAVFVKRPTGGVSFQANPIYTCATNNAVAGAACQGGTQPAGA